MCANVIAEGSEGLEIGMGAKKPDEEWLVKAKYFKYRPFPKILPRSSSLDLGKVL